MDKAANIVLTMTPLLLLGKKWVISAGTYFYKHVILALVHCWQKFKARSDDDVREKLFCSWNFFLTNAAAVVVSMEINRMHYFLRKWKRKLSLLFCFYSNISMHGLLIYLFPQYNHFVFINIYSFFSLSLRTKI